MELGGLPFKVFASQRSKWALNDCYRVPGPVQLDLGGKQKKADGTHVDPLCFTLALELEERSGAHGPAPAKPATAANGNLDAYFAYLEGTISTEGPAGVDAHDVHKLELYRLSHGISDADHEAVLKRLSLSVEDWKGIVARTRKQAAGHA